MPIDYFKSGCCEGVPSLISESVQVDCELNIPEDVILTFVQPRYGLGGFYPEWRSSSRRR